jgi:hypothetical protein
MRSVTPSVDASPPAGGERELAFDLVRGIATYTGNGLVTGLGRVLARHPDADIGTAFNRKQVACKIWARDKLIENLGGRFRRVWILGGWYGVLAAMLFDDPRFDIETIESIDIDPDVAAVARTLVGDKGGQFRASTHDMYELDYAAQRPDLVINTSCEHIASLRGWLDLLPPRTSVLLQSNDYFSEPSHVNCMPSLAAFTAAAELGKLDYAGELPQKNYTRFMLIGAI